MRKPKLTIEEYQKAVWDFMMEHCDVQNSGALFVKFHCDDRANFEKRVMARANGYHRTDGGKRAEKLKRVEKKEVYLMRKYARRKWGKWYRFVKFLYE